MRRRAQVGGAAFRELVAAHGAGGGAVAVSDLPALAARSPVALAAFGGDGSYAPLLVSTPPAAVAAVVLSVRSSPLRERG